MRLVGIYGVMAASVARRRREFGVCLALGARPADVAALVQRGVVRLVAVGLAGGLLGAAVALPLLRTLFYGVGVTDPVTVAAVVAVLAAAAVASTGVPTRHAASVAPDEAIHAE